MSDIINLLSRAKNSESLDATKALLESAIQQVGGIITNKDKLQNDLEKANEAKRVAEEKATGLESELAEAKKGIPAKAKLDRLEMYEALGTPDELTERIAALAAYKELGEPDQLKGLSSKVRQSELKDFGLKPVIFDQFFSDVTPTYEGEGDERTVIYKRGEETVSLEDLAKEKGLEVSDLQTKTEPSKPETVRVIEQADVRKPTSGKLTVEQVIQEKQKSNLYQA